MIIKNALDFIINSTEFKALAKNLPESGVFCRNVDAKLLADVAKEMYYCEVYFDFGNAGNSMDDILARVQYHNDGSFSFLHLSNLE